MTVSTDTPRVPLTATEAKVARLMSLGYDYDRIGKELAIDERTVSVHVANIAAKFDNPEKLKPQLLVTVWAVWDRLKEERRESAA